jgi:hypothetical protein
MDGSNPADGTPDIPTPRAGYQGEPGSFSARAAARAGRPLAYATFDRLLKALVAGEVDVAVLPAAALGAGPVVEPLEALSRAVEAGARLDVTAEIVVPVRLVLAAPPGVAEEDVREIHSQPRRTTPPLRPGASRSSGGRARPSARRRRRSRRASSSSRRTCRT